MEKAIKIILAILMLVCLAKMPYGYYQFVRFAAMIGFALLACFSYKEKREIEIEMIVYIALAVLFQPLFKIALGRTLWNVVDVIVATGLIVSVFIQTKKEKK
jgi:hypothetical protein